MDIRKTFVGCCLRSPPLFSTDDRKRKRASVLAHLKRSFVTAFATVDRNAANCDALGVGICCKTEFVAVRQGKGMGRGDLDEGRVSRR